MNNYLQPKDDGLPARKSGVWAKDKLLYLEKYIDTFETSMRGKPWRRRIFIDLFSGPGKGVISGTTDFILSSPLIALATEFPFTDYYFVDKDSESVAALEKEKPCIGHTI